MKNIAVYLCIILVVIFLVYYSFERFADLSLFLYGEMPSKDGKTVPPNGETIKLVMLFVGGVIAIFTLIDNARKTRVLASNNISGQFKNGIELLGSDIDSIVIGGIYLLHSIAKNNVEYKKPVFFVLTNYLKKQTKIELENKWHEYIKEKNEMSFPFPLKFKLVLDLLFKIDKDCNKVYLNCKESFITDLSGSFFCGAQLSNLLLSHVDLSNANLNNSLIEKVKFENCNLNNILIQNSDLRNVSFNNSNANKINFLGSKLLNIFFYGSSLSDSNFILSDLNNIVMQGLKFTNSIDIRCSKVQNIDFRGANINCLKTEGSEVLNICLAGAFKGTNQSRGYIRTIFRQAGESSDKSIVSHVKLGDGLKNEIKNEIKIYSMNIPANYITQINNMELNDLIEFSDDDIYKKLDAIKMIFKYISITSKCLLWKIL